MARLRQSSPKCLCLIQNKQNIVSELQALVENVSCIRDEVLNLDERIWIPWPEQNLAKSNSNSTPASREKTWTVFPFVHCFPGNDESKRTWLPSSSLLCPKTSALLKEIPKVRTALFSKMAGNTKLENHRGWEDLSNHVLRCHLSLVIPTEDSSKGLEKPPPCGLWVDGFTRYHQEKEILVFDDSKLHHAFNESDFPRYVLIVDMERPDYIPKGKAVGGYTSELEDFLSRFR